MSSQDPDPQTPQEVTQVSDAALRAFFGYQLKRSFNVVQADLARTLLPFELRMMTYTALVLIDENPGLRQSQLAEAMDVERPNLVVIIDELEGRDLVLRQKVPHDRRAYALRTTLAGRRLVTRARRAVRQHEERLLAGIDGSLREAAERVLRAIEAHRDGS